VFAFESGIRGVEDEMRPEVDKIAKTIVIKIGIIDRRTSPVLRENKENRSRK